MANQLFSQVVADYYKASSESINTVAKRDIRRKSLKGIMQESFLHDTFKSCKNHSFTAQATLEQILSLN